MTGDVPAEHAGQIPATNMPEPLSLWRFTSDGRFVPGDDVRQVRHGTVVRAEPGGRVLVTLDAADGAVIACHLGVRGRPSRPIHGSPRGPHAS